MKKCFVAVALLSLTCFLGCGNLTLLMDSETQGYWFKNGLETDHTWYDSIPSESDVVNFIKASDGNRDESVVTNQEIARKIINVSGCFKLDARIFTALIKKESRFKIDAVSPTYAVGLTQMTGIAIDEVNDQLGKEPEKTASTYAINYFQNIATTCATSISSFLWNDYTSKGDMKYILKTDSDYSLIYGAIVLKAYVTLEYAKSSDFDTIYRNALLKYNGEGKASYASDIISWADNI